MDPAPYVHGWHLEAIADHLEAVTHGQIRKLLINIPPRHSKSLLTSVSWPAWTWAKERDTDFPLIGSQVKFLCLSYSDVLSLDLALAMRRLVTSDWYRANWGDRVQIAPDQEAKSKFDTKTGGTRISSSFSGTVTGRGGDIKVIDDPMKADEAQSEAIRESVLRKYDGVLKSRMTDPRITAEVVVMQRLHEMDLSGHILESDPDFVHLNLPAEYDPGRHCVTCIGWEDPRKEEGELLWPERFGPEELKPFKRNSYEWNGQWMQSPIPPGGGIFKIDDWQLWEPEDGNFPVFDYVVASLDGAFTAKASNDPSGFTIWGTFTDRNGNPAVMAIFALRARLELHGPYQEKGHNETAAAYLARTRGSWGLVETVAHHCRRFKVHKLLIENKASGHDVAVEMRRLYANEGWNVQLVDPKKLDKVARAYSVQPAFTDKLVWIPLYLPETNPQTGKTEFFNRREWADMLVSEMAGFSALMTHRFDDLTDSSCMALKHLRDSGLLIRREERRAHEAALAQPQTVLSPLYPV